jgi:integrase
VPEQERIHVYVLQPPDRPHLQLQWVDPETGLRKTVSAKTTDPEEAERAGADKEYELNHGLHQEVSQMTWARFRVLFTEEHVAGLRPRSREKYDTVLDVFEEVVRPRRLRDAALARTVSRFVKGLRGRPRPGGRVGLAAQTIKNYLIALKTAFAWAYRQKLLTSVPEFPRVKVPRKKPQPIPPEDFEKLLAKAPDALWRAYLLCGWWGGLRLSEARHLRWDPSETLPWLDLPGNRIVLPAVFAKADEDQWVPLHPKLREALEALPRTGPEVFPFRSRKTGEPLSRGAISHRVLDMAKRAGVRLSMHRLRKGFGCRAAKMLGKGGAALLHELMRHSSMQVTMDYYASVDDALQDAINRLV